METSRRRHACTKVTLNGRPGLVVSGGVSSSSKNLTSVEFYDSASGQWASLPDLQRGRRSHAMLVHNGRLTVTGGVQADGRLMRDSEEFDGKRWIDSRSNLREPRQGFSLIKVLNLQFIKASSLSLSRCQPPDSQSVAGLVLAPSATGIQTVSQKSSIC